MTKPPLVVSSAAFPGLAPVSVPAMIAAAGETAGRRFIEFFVANIRNKNTRLAYAQAVGRFCAWCEQRRFTLDLLEPVVIAAYVEELVTIYEKPTVKQHLAAIRMLFDWLVVGQVLPMNPASSPKTIQARNDIS